MSVNLSARDLTVTFAAPGGGSLAALGPVSFEIGAGEFVSVIGPSGCGKSTLVRVFAGLQAATAGEARLNGRLITEPLPRVGMMFQDANLMPWRTVLDNIALPLELAGISKPDRYDTVQDLLPVLELGGFEMAYPGELSGGMAQRVALGRVLVQHPEVLLLDEPFGALDALTRETIGMDLLRMWTRERQTVMMVTHDINEAVLLSDWVFVMSRRPGRIAAAIPVELSRPRALEQIYSIAFVEIAGHVRYAIDQP